MNINLLATETLLELIEVSVHNHQCIDVFSAMTLRFSAVCANYPYVVSSVINTILLNRTPWYEIKYIRNRQWHRDGDKPAIIHYHYDGTIYNEEYYQNDELYRDKDIRKMEYIVKMERFLLHDILMMELNTSIHPK